VADLPENIDLEPLPFDEAIEYFADLVPLTPDEFYGLAQAAQARAFTVARVASMDVIMDVHGAVAKALEAGETLRDFQGRIDDIVETRGWSGLTPWHAETVFRNNIQTAYSTGRYKQMVDQKDAFPYWEYDAVNDADTRPEHAALDGKIFPADHSFWDIWYPPNGHRCRCGVNPVHKYDVEEGDVQTIESEDPTGGLIEPVDPVTGQKLPARPLMPDPGWDYNPAKQDWQPDLSKYPAELKTQYLQDQASL
jgi:SPP1 gp7 family putative phage head morphogenesis protein